MAWSRPRVAGLCTWVVMLGLLLPMPAVAAPEYVRFYKTGLTAAESGEWQQVEKMMLEAIERQPEEKKSRMVVFRRGYFPHYYLGLARYHRGNCAGALASWARSEQQGVIVGRDEYVQLLRLQDDCQDHGAPTREGKASASGSEAVKGGKTGKERVRSAQHVVDKGADPTKKALGAVEKVAPNSDLGEAARDGQNLIGVAEAASDVVDMAMPPKQRLEAAVNAYFAGNPRQTLEHLADIDQSDPRARAQVYLFRAAANFRLHLLAGGDDSRLAAARKNASLFQQEQWRDDFPAELFDPRFVRLVRGGG